MWRQHASPHAPTRALSPAPTYVSAVRASKTPAGNEVRALPCSKRILDTRSSARQAVGVHARACPPFVSSHGERNPTENPKLLSRGGKRGVDAHRWFLAVLKGRDRFGRNPSTVQRCEFLSLHVDVAARGPSVECDYGESDVRAVVLWVFLLNV